MRSSKLKQFGLVMTGMVAGVMISLNFSANADRSTQVEPGVLARRDPLEHCLGRRQRSTRAIEVAQVQVVALWFKAEGKWITGLLGAGKLKHNFIHHQAPLPGLWQLVQLCVQLRQKPRQV